MLELLFSAIPGGSLTAIGAAVVAVLGIVWSLIRKGRSIERNAQRAKEADHYARYLDEIERSASARADADRRNAGGRLRDDDGYKRR